MSRRPAERPQFEQGVVTKVYAGGALADIQVGDRRDADGNLCPWGHVPVAGEPAYVGQPRIVGPLAGSWKAPISPAPSGDAGAGEPTEQQSVSPAVSVDWPISAGGPFPHRSRFATSDCGWRAWELDPDWIIAGPVGEPVGYTIGTTGWIAYYYDGNVYGHLASTGAEQWTHGIALATPRLWYNAARQELVIVDLSNGQVTVIDPETGLNVAGPTVCSDLIGASSFVFHGNYLVTGTPDVHASNGARWPRYVRDTSNASSYTSSGYTGYCYVAPGTHFGASAGALMLTSEGKFPAWASSQRGVGGFPLATYTESALFLIDVATGAAQVVRRVRPSSANYQGGGNEGAMATISVTSMGSDGHMCGTWSDSPIGPGTVGRTYASVYTKSGGMLWEQDTTAAGPFWTWQETLGVRSMVLSGNLDVLRVMRNGSSDWTRAWNTMTDGYVAGGEDADGTDGWVLFDDGLGADDSLKAYSVANGRLLGVWRGGGIAMVSHGRIYTYEGSDLRRWAAI